MGFLCGSGGGANTTVVQNDIPDWMENFTKETLNRADSVSSQPYQPFTGDRVAPLNQDFASGFDTIRSGSGAYTPTVNRAIGATEGAATGYGKEFTPGGVTPQSITPGSLAGTDLSAYMNPYTQSVIDTTVADIGRTKDIALNKAGGNLAASNAFGGARHGVIEAEIEKNSQEASAQAVANLMMQNFGQAQGAATGDINRSMQADLANQGVDLGAQQFNQQMGLNSFAANAGLFTEEQRRALAAGGQLGQLGQLGQSMNLTDATQLMGIGQIQQGQEQQQADFDYESYLRQFQYPFDVQNFRTAVATGQPYPQQQTTTAPGGSSAAQNLGLFAAMAGMGYGGGWGG